MILIALATAITAAAPAPGASACEGPYRNGQMFDGGFEPGENMPELVISNVKPSSLADARAHRVTTVKDGEPVYLYLKLPKPVENYVFTWNLTGTSQYANRKALGIQITPIDHPDDVPATLEENFLPTDAELKATEIVIEMAPGELRPLSVYGWLRLVGGGRTGTWANEFRIYSRIVLPLAMPALLTLGLFHLMFNWNDLLWPLVLTTDTAMQTLPAGLAMFMGQHVVEYGLLMAGATMAMVPMLLAFVVVQRRFIEGIATTGLK